MNNDTTNQPLSAGEPAPTPDAVVTASRSEAIWNAVQELAPWTESNDMEWEDEILCGLAGVKDALSTERHRADRAEARLQKANDYIGKMDRVIDEAGIAESCINPLEDLRIAIQKSKERFLKLENECAILRADNDRLRREVEAHRIDAMIVAHELDLRNVQLQRAQEARGKLREALALLKAAINDVVLPMVNDLLKQHGPYKGHDFVSTFLWSNAVAKTDAALAEKETP